MSAGSVIWIGILILAGLLFFGTAIAITVIGIQDLRDLLRKSGTKRQPGN